MITYSLGREPVSRRTQEAASAEAKLFSEICERLIELDELKHTESLALIRRMATLGSLSYSAYITMLHAGCGQIDAIVSSYEEQTEGRGVTRQALHWNWAKDQRAIKRTFPMLAEVLQTRRDSVAHHEDAMSAADAMRDSRRSVAQEGDI